MENKKQLNGLLACIEGLACIAIVFLHCSGYTGPAGDLVNLGSRFAVPVFCMVSGFYLFHPDASAPEKAQRLRRKIRHIFRMAVAVSLLYLGYLLVTRKLLDGASLKGMWMEYFSLRDTVMWLLFNRVSYASHLWFLYALLYVYLILYGLVSSRRRWARKVLQSDLLPFALACGGILLRFLAYFSPAEIWYFSVADIIFYRNWIFTGLPFVLMGYCLRRHLPRLRRCSVGVAAALCGGGIVLTVAEWKLYLTLFHTYPDLYLGTVVLSVGLFVLAILRPAWGGGTLLARFGRQFSMPVYLLHPLMFWVLRREYGMLGGNEETPWFFWGKPVLVLVLSVLGSALYLCGKRRRTGAGKGE